MIFVLRYWIAFALAWIGLVALSPAEAGPLASRVLLVSIDGLRPDAITEAHTPTLARLVKQGASSLTAQTIFPSRTLPAHTSMTTGLVPARHGMVENSWAPGQPQVGVDTIFGIVKRQGLVASMVVGKTKLGFLATPGTVDFYAATRSRAKLVAAQAARFLTETQPHLCFVHFPDADWAGHLRGWMSEAYLDALGRVDRALMRLLDVLRRAGLAAETLLIVTSDHGGSGHDHGSARPEDMTIPWIAFGSMVPPGYAIPGRVTVTDTAPTILFALGLPVPSHWDGQAITAIFR
ncbi:MAG: alkaline phosphatase family protein [Candidatus Methylomirabilales bacterium]